MCHLLMYFCCIFDTEEDNVLLLSLYTFKIEFATPAAVIVSVLSAPKTTSRHPDDGKKKIPVTLLCATTHVFFFLTARVGITLCSFDNMSSVALPSTARREGQVTLISK